MMRAVGTWWRGIGCAGMAALLCGALASTGAADETRTRISVPQATGTPLPDGPLDLKFSLEGEAAPAPAPEEAEDAPPLVDQDPGEQVRLNRERYDWSGEMGPWEVAPVVGHRRQTGDPETPREDVDRKTMGIDMKLPF